MQYLLLFFIAISLYFQPLSAEETARSNKTICLNMIIKDEAPVIRRCLASVKPFIDYWVIVDTGSSDHTQEIVKEFMKDIPGELYERPWKNFGHNRNEALQLAKGKGDYLLFIDADEVLRFDPGFQKPFLDKDFYYITTEFSGTHYGRVQLINNHLDWKWMGVLHEYVESPQAKTSATLPHVANLVRTDGNRSQDSKKYQKDAALLEKALQEEPNNTRYQFYLAQSYRDAEDYEKAIEHYQKRVKMKGWDQEVFWSLFQIAILQELLKKDHQTVVQGYYNAYAFRPDRIEPLYRLALYQRNQGNFKEAYQAAFKGLSRQTSNDILFVEKWIYDYGLLLEFSIAAYWLEKYPEAFLASHLILVNSQLPPEVKKTVQSNLIWINQKMNLTANN